MKNRGLVFVGLVLSHVALWGNPEHPTVVAGSATFDSSDPHTLNVSATDRSVIAWDSFSIASGETTYFELPSVDSTVLNRVTSSDPSVLAGFLRSNGQVYLINQNGILVTDQGVINTAGFLASTLDVADSNFLSGGNLLFSGVTESKVINRGQITAWNGDLILLGYQVENSELLESTGGVVGMGAGHSIILRPSGQQRIAVQLTGGVGEQVIGVNNEAVIKAVQAELKADGSLYGLAVQHEGFISATSSATVMGKVYLVAAEGVTQVAGGIQAAGFDSIGGEIQILGESVIVTDAASLDVSGSAGGGSVLIGGSFQGMDPAILNATHTYVDGSVVILASGTGQAGDGGEVVVWSDQDTFFYGVIRAEGAPFGGNGGSVEVSGVDFLDFQGTVSTYAPNGATGTLLLDPTNITVDNTGPTTALFNTAPCGANTYCGGALNSAVILISDLLTQLLSTNVIIDSSQGTGIGTGTIALANALTVPLGSNNLTFNARTSFTSNAGAVITNNGGNAITINSATGAAGNITFSANVVNAGSGTVNINSGTAATGNVSLSAGVNFSNTGSGNFNVTAGSSPVNTGTLGTSTTSTLTNSGSGNMGLTATSTAGATAISILGPIVHSSTGTFQVTTNVGNLSTAATTTMTYGAGSGAVTFNVAGTSGATALTIGGPVAHSGSSNFQVLATLGNISFSSAATLAFSGGAPILIQTSSGTGSVTLGGSSMSFSGAGGALTVTAGGGLAINGPITGYSYPGPFQLTSSTSTISTNSSGSMTFNSGAGNVIFSAPQGGITTNATATLLFNPGAGNLTFTSGTPAMFVGTTTASSTMTFNSGAGRAITVNANGALTLGNVNYGSTGDCVITSTNGSISLTSGTTLNWGPGPIAAGSLFLNSSAAINGSSGITFSALAGNSPTALSLVAVTGISLATGGITYSSPYNVVMNNTGPGTINSTSTMVFNAGAGGLSVTGSNLVGSSALTFASLLTYSTINPCQMSVSSGDLTISGTINFNGGAPFTVQNTSATGLLTFSGGTKQFTGGNGPLTISSVGNLSIGAAISHSYNNLSQITSSGGQISTSLGALIWSGSGGLTLNAFTTVALSGTFIYTSTGPASLVSVTDAIRVVSGMTLSTTALLSMTTTPGGTDIIIGNTVANNSSGGITVSAQRDFILGVEAASSDCLCGSASGNLTIFAGRDVIVDAGVSGTVAQIGYNSGNINSNITFTSIGRDLVVQGGITQNAYALIGHGSPLGKTPGGIVNGNITFGSIANPIGRNVMVSALPAIGSFTNSTLAFAQIGHAPSSLGATTTATGDIDLRFVTGSVAVSGGNSLTCYGMIGHGGGSTTRLDSFSGSVRVGAQQEIALAGGTEIECFAAIGHVSFFNGLGTMTLQSDLIEVISGSTVSLTTGGGADALIGLCLTAPSGGLGAVSANQITVQAGSLGDVIVSGAIASTSSNRVLVGALSYTGVVPIVAAGTATAPVSITAGGDLILAAAKGGGIGNGFALITSGIGATTPFDVSINVGGGVVISGGNYGSSVASIHDLFLSCVGDCQLFGSIGGGGGLSAARNLVLNTGTIQMAGGSSTQLASLVSTGGNIQITTQESRLFGNAAISSFGDLTATLAGSLFMGSGVAVTVGGDYVFSIDGSATLAAGANSIITGSASGSFTVSDSLYLIGDSLGAATISASGALTVASTGGSIFLLAVPTLQNASIISNSGGLTVTAAQDLVLFGSGRVQIASGAGALAVTATQGQFLLEGGSLISHLGSGALTCIGNAGSLYSLSQIAASGSGLLRCDTTGGDLGIYSGASVVNTGSGGVSSSVNNTLYIAADSTGPTGIQAGSGGATLGMTELIMGGSIAGVTGEIAATGGSLLITSTANAVLNPFSLIDLSGTSGALLMTVGGDLVVEEGSSILTNLVTGGSTLNVSGNGTFLPGSACTSANDLTLTAAQNIAISGAQMAALGSLAITSSRDILVDKGGILSAVLNLDLVAARNLAILDSGALEQTGGGLVGVSFAANTGNCTLAGNSHMISMGGNGVSGVVGGAALIRGSEGGDSFIAAQGPLTVTVSGALDLIAQIGGNAALSSLGSVSVVGAKVNLLGVDSLTPTAYIEGGSGNLSISGGSVGLLDGAYVRLNGGSGSLSITASNGDVNIENGAFLENLGSGLLAVNAGKSFYLSSGLLGGAQVLGGVGGASIAAASIALEGMNGGSFALVSAQAGPLSLASTFETQLYPYAQVMLLGGTGALQVTANADLFVGNNGLIQNSGAGSTTLAITGSATFLADTNGAATLQGGTGDLLFSATDSIRLFSSIENGASILSSGNVTVSTNQDFLSVGVAQGMSPSGLSTSSGFLTLMALGNVALRDGGVISITGGSGLISVNASKDFSLENGAFVSNAGTGGIALAVGGHGWLRAGSAGDAFILGNGTLVATVAGSFNLEAASGNVAYLSSNGNTAVSIGSLYISSSSIRNTLGTLAISGGSIEIVEGGLISLGMGSAGLLTLNTFVGNLRFSNGSGVENLGSGGISSSVNKTLFLEGGMLGLAQIMGGSGGVTITSNGTALAGGVISASGGDLKITSATTTNINPFSQVALTGGAGALEVTAHLDLLLANNSSIVNGGTGPTTFTINRAATLQGGSFGPALVQSGAGTLTMSVGDNLQLFSDLGGAATILGQGNVVISSLADISIVGAAGIGLMAGISSSGGALSLTAGNNFFISDLSYVEVGAGAGVLSLIATNGDLYLQNGSYVRHQGIGSVAVNIKKSAYLKAGYEGDGFLSSNGALTFTSGGDLHLEAASNGSSYLSSSGATLVTSSRLLMLGYNNSFPARIVNGSGNLTVSSGVIDMIDVAQIDLTGGSGALTVNATTGNCTIANGSRLQHLGSGLLTSNVNNGTLYLEGNLLGESAVLGGTGGVSISAGAVLMSGSLAIQAAAISSAGGNLSLTTGRILNLTPFSEVVLLGGAGALNVSVGGNLYLADNTLIYNFGSGPMTITVTGTSYTCH